MLDINSVADAFGVLCDPQGPDGFKHLATAWHLGAGDWVSVWDSSEVVPAHLQLVTVTGQHIETVTACETEKGVLGFKSIISQHSLSAAKDAVLNKRDHLSVIGYPSLIDHPIFSLHRGSLSAERYYPYLCPWTLEGHLGLFSMDDGYITGQFYHGMQGSPVMNAAMEVVGIVLDGTLPDPLAVRPVPALTRFRRLA